MNATQIRDLAIKLLGVYCTMHVIMSLPNFLMMFSPPHQEAIGDRTALIVGPGVSLFLYCIISYLLLFHSRRVIKLLWPGEEEATGATSVALPLATWVSLIGLFYLIGALAGSVSLGAKIVSEWTRWRFLDFRSYDVSRLLTELIQLVLAVVCIAKARSIADYLKRETEEVVPTSSLEA